LIGLQSFQLFALPEAGGSSALSINDIVVAEGSNGTVNATFSVDLFPASTETVTVNFGTIDGTAQAGSDYVGTNGTVTFLPGQTTQLISVLVTADASPEPEETFYVLLHDPVNATLASHSRGTCIITEVQIADISVDTTIRFHTIMNRNYILERSDIGLNNWTTVSGADKVPGTGGLVTVVDKGSGCTSGRIYRASLLP
jgi:hypothetical protein